MVHVFCQNSDCRMIIHLNDSTHWNYKGLTECKKCSTVIEVEIRNGEIIHANRAK